MQILYDARGKLTPQSCFWFCFKFKLIQTFIIVLITCKNEEDPIKNEGARAVTTMLHYPSFFSDVQRQLTP